MPKLYVSTYHKYNSGGSIVGKWLDLEDYDDVDEFLKACAELHKDEHDPEFMFQDYEDMPRELYSESCNTHNLQRIFDWLALHDYEREIVTEYIDATGQSWSNNDIADVWREAQDHFFCQLDDDMSIEKEMGYYVVQEGLLGCKIPEQLANHIDYESLGRAWLDQMWVSSNRWVFTW